MTRITRMLRFGSQWRVWLECGHAFPSTAAQLKEKQLFIGKPVVCGLCGVEHK